jgi:glycosyltransferase involved in cell wall biosynthesis
MTNNSIMVSVSMITYKHELYIREAIEGVLMQQVNFPVELIIADDCSPDNTSTIVEEIIENHPNGHWIKYFRHSQI